MHVSVYKKVRTLATRAVGEFPSSINLRLQKPNWVADEELSIALNVKFVVSQSSLLRSHLGILYIFLLGRFGISFSAPGLSLSPCKNILFFSIFTIIPSNLTFIFELDIVFFGE